MTWFMPLPMIEGGCGRADAGDKEGAPVAELESVVHIFIMSNATGETAVFLIEREPGIVEFPMLTLPASVLGDEEAIVQRIESRTGLRVALSGFLDPPVGDSLSPQGSRFLLAKRLEGTPRVDGEHAGWEWRPAGSLLSLQFVPKDMAAELRSHMNS